MLLNRTKLQFIFIFLLICLSMASCKKNPFDYRSKYIGKYCFSIQKTFWSISGVVLDTVYSYEGKITNGSQKKTMEIFYSDNASVEAYIYEDGTLGECNTSQQINLKGEFESSKKIRFCFKTGGLGSGQIFGITGDRK